MILTGVRLSDQHHAGLTTRSPRLYAAASAGLRSRSSRWLMNLTTCSRVAPRPSSTGTPSSRSAATKGLRRSSSLRRATTTAVSRHCAELQQEEKREQRLALLADALVRLAAGGEQVTEAFDLLGVIEEVATEDGDEALGLEKRRQHQEHEPTLRRTRRTSRRSGAPARNTRLQLRNPPW